jgi:hypothetical protein
VRVAAGISVAIGTAALLLASADPPENSAIRSLSHDYAQVLNDMYSNIARNPQDARLRQLTCQKDHVNLDRQHAFRLRFPPPAEAIAYYQEVTVEPGDVTAAGDHGEFTIVEHHPQQDPQYQRYSVEKVQGMWKICSSN